MKPSSVFPAAFAAMLILSPLAVRAADTTEPVQRNVTDVASAQPKLSDEQKQRLKEGAMKRFDKNGDGKLDDAEKAEAKAAREQMREEALKRFDKDGDGKLNDAERAEAREAMKKLKKRRGAE